jgi:arylsulfatase A-like enzyme
MREARVPQPEAPRSRSEAPVALAVAALVLSAVEFNYSLAERWYHAPAYYLLSIGLTLGLAVPAALLGVVARVAAGPALALWLGASLGISLGWVEGLCAGLGSLALLSVPLARRAAPLALGTISGLALAVGYLKRANFAEHLGHKDDLVLESVGAVLLLLVALAGLALVLEFTPKRVGSGLRCLVLVAAGCLLAWRPALDRGDGEHRRPPLESAALSADLPEDPRPNVLVLVLDTVRADHVSLYGYERDTTPELASWAAKRGNAAVFPNAFANGTWTVPSHASLFTGQFPSTHGAHFALDGTVRVGFGLEPSVPTLAEVLKDSNYTTVAGYANHWLRSVHGMQRGFDRYMRAPDVDELPFVGEDLRARFLPGVMWEVGKGCARAPEVNATLLSLVEPWSRGKKPLFAFANYVDAHGPYAPPPPFRGRFQASSWREHAEHLEGDHSRERIDEQRARYDEELAYLDHHLGRLFTRLDELALFDETWVFVTSDHGEAFGEHGVYEHGTTVHSEVTRVPLIVFPPRGVTLPVTDAPVSLVDVAATVAAIAGTELPGPGRDLRSHADAGTHASVLEFYGDPVKAARLGPLAKRPARSVVLGRHKLIAYADSYHLYDIQDDPLETVDLANALPHLVEHMRALLPEFGSPTFRSDAEAPGNDALQALKGMGYLGGAD